MFALIDANNFYVSCERVFQPRLVGRPVVVLSSNDGACIARSNEAKALGVKMAQPWFQVKHLERDKGLIAVSANFELYSDMSSRMMAVEGRYAPRQEVYSIDESFLDFSGVKGDLAAIGRGLRAAVLKETGLPTSVGFGSTKTLAKLANNVAKSADRKPGTYPDGYPADLAQVCNFGELSADALSCILGSTEVGDIWGVGRRIAADLIANGILTALDLSNADAAVIRKRFSVVFEKTVLELRGISCKALADNESQTPAKQQILVSRSFGKPISNIDGVVEAVSEFASRAAEKLRAQRSAAGAIGVFFATSPFREKDPQHVVNEMIPLIRPTNDSRLLAGAVVALARHRFREGFGYAKAGVVLSDIHPEGEFQGELDLFGPSSEDEKAAKDAAHTSNLMHTVDALNQRFGRDAVKLGSAALVSNGEAVRSWSTKQERRTPRYTTRWNEILTVKT